MVGPRLKLHQCGLPKKIALELYQPFIIRKLKEMGHADTIKSAKKMLERKDEEVWDILEAVITNHPVMLNRAPTLHRMGIQAFEPVLVEGNAIHLASIWRAKGLTQTLMVTKWPSTCRFPSRHKSKRTHLMLSTNNIFGPANGRPIMSPSQDVVMGCYYITMSQPDLKGQGHGLCISWMEADLAHSLGMHRSPCLDQSANFPVTVESRRKMTIVANTVLSLKPPTVAVLFNMMLARRDGLLQHLHAVGRVVERDFRLLPGAGSKSDDSTARRHESAGISARVPEVACRSRPTIWLHLTAKINIIGEAEKTVTQVQEALRAWNDHRRRALQRSPRRLDSRS